MTAPVRPPKVKLVVGSREVAFVLAGDEKYGVELDGKPAVLRMHGQGEGPANIDALLRCLQLKASTTSINRGIQIEATDNWGHFRQNTFYRVRVVIADGGAVEIRSDVHEQDESYY